MARRDHSRSRRDVVQTGAAALAAGATVGIAGCTGGSGGDGTDEAADDGTPTDQRTPTATREPIPFRDSLVAYYPLNAGQGDTAPDASDSGNAATVKGANWTAKGSVGGALSFDGEDDLVETPVKYADLTGGFTFEAWARNDDLTSGWGWVFTQREERDQWSQLGVHGGGEGRLRWELLVGDGTQATIDAPAGTVKEGTWHHWVGTWANGEGLRLYIDAELVATSTKSTYCARGCDAGNTKALASKGPINMGAQGRQAEYWTGLIDEAKIYDRALTADEVSRVYNATDS